MQKHGETVALPAAELKVKYSDSATVTIIWVTTVHTHKLCLRVFSYRPAQKLKGN